MQLCGISSVIISQLTTNFIFYPQTNRPQTTNDALKQVRFLSKFPLDLSGEILHNSLIPRGTELPQICKTACIACIKSFRLVRLRVTSFFPHRDLYKSFHYYSPKKPSDFSEGFFGARNNLAMLNKTGLALASRPVLCYFIHIGGEIRQPHTQGGCIP